VISFSGGVADCIEKERPWNAYGDLGPVRGRVIRESRLCRGEYRLGSETIRATVIGAGCHSTQLSGSTIFYRNVEFPLKNLPVVAVPRKIQNSPELGAFLRREMAQRETAAVIALPGLLSPDHGTVRTLAKALSGVTGKLLVCLETDMAKALGQALALEVGPEREILCLDRVKLPQGSYLDVGAPLGPALPVVVKTLAFER
jgi:ethanolamine utilization protein EutA